jgi:Protein of unknown function (DUF3768)
MTTRQQAESASEQNENTGCDRATFRCPQEAHARLARIHALNDRLRTTGRGGIVLMTEGIAGLGASTVNEVFKAVAAFDSFNSDNDPWGEHDCALLTVSGIKILWKIEYFDRTRTYHSPDPACPKLTVRVMTVMRADEY